MSAKQRMILAGVIPGVVLGSGAIGMTYLNFYTALFLLLGGVVLTVTLIVGVADHRLQAYLGPLGAGMLCGLMLGFGTGILGLSGTLLFGAAFFAAEGLLLILVLLWQARLQEEA